ncbi:proton/sodium-glutamate symport protein [Alcanivorax hongdengensis A-11-3]|uniref:Proton/sodium-glutamate symport protein n=1 Tax=Alcanivorax hongdengensis A-11-3 TaxID=1177179 RepID=L0WBR3_9GAMM|nr:dicarboxylate/amino acid:cation symporter [Alcanivorax hongdengensis]EKF73537.1 proton/sodium-glutamate symport protein [Alcanivorax hongdengensis A-11-3]
MAGKSRLFAVPGPSRSLKQLSSSLTNLVQGRLWLKVLLAMVAGIVTGMALGPSVGWVRPDTGVVIGNWLAFPGQLFLAVIQMVVIPLVFASIIRGLAAGENLEQLRRMGLVVVGYFVATTAAAAAIGLWIANLIQPGRFLSPDQLQVQAAGLPADITPLDGPSFSAIPDKLLGLLPGNPLQSMVEGQMLQVVIFAVMVGVALISMSKKEATPMLELLGSLQQVCMTVVRWAMLLAPIAVFGLMARLTSQTGLDALLGMAVYVLTVLAGLLLLLAGYLALVSLFGKLLPRGFLGAVREVVLLAFSTSSSAAVMPLSIKTAEDKLQVRPAISQFVIPLGATINMNGTALYQAIAAVFLAQVFNIDIGLGGMALVVIMAVGASIGSPGTPGVGIVILATTLATIGVPPSGIALIMGVDRILDMSRTAINVTGDLVAARLLDKWMPQETVATSQPAS